MFFVSAYVISFAHAFFGFCCYFVLFFNKSRLDLAIIGSLRFDDGNVNDNATNQ